MLMLISSFFIAFCVLVSHSSLPNHIEFCLQRQLCFTIDSLIIFSILYAKENPPINIISSWLFSKPLSFPPLHAHRKAPLYSFFGPLALYSFYSKSTGSSSSLRCVITRPFGCKGRGIFWALIKQYSILSILFLIHICSFFKYWYRFISYVPCFPCLHVSFLWFANQNDVNELFIVDTRYQEYPFSSRGELPLAGWIIIRVWAGEI